MHRAGSRWPQAPAGLDVVRFRFAVPVQDGLKRRPG
ncbi:hypothetical protein SFR_0983 [Streptomyces sp. FR-008]|nr:hypothetical protein SFR_0983 [Streptomyces sp. FR-008]